VKIFAKTPFLADMAQKIKKVKLASKSIILKLIEVPNMMELTHCVIVPMVAVSPRNKNAIYTI